MASKTCMVAVDTNILVRILTRDDEDQYQKAYALFQHEQIYITNTVLLETEWVLRYAYDFPPAKIVRAFQMLCGLSNIIVEDSAIIARVLDWHTAGIDFADAFHLAGTQHCTTFYTFDETLVKKGRKVSLCQVATPS